MICEPHEFGDVQFPGHGAGNGNQVFIDPIGPGYLEIAVQEHPFEY